MGQASSSSSATTAIDASGGQLNINQPNYLMWGAVIVALIIGAYLWLHRKR